VRHLGGAIGVDNRVLVFFKAFVDSYLGQYGVSDIYLIGSRAYGTPRPDSDHDFFVVVKDSAPIEISTGRELHFRIFNILQSECLKCGVGGVDILISRESDFYSEKDTPGMFAYDAFNRGVLLWVDED
jgi:predicted nucleotidyltransferase